MSFQKQEANVGEDCAKDHVEDNDSPDKEALFIEITHEHQNPRQHHYHSHPFIRQLFFFNLYFWEREREREREKTGEGQTGRHRIWSGLQALSCQHKAWCGARTPGPQDHDLSRSWMLNRLSHSGTPIHQLLINSVHWNFLKGIPSVVGSIFEIIDFYLKYSLSISFPLSQADLRDISLGNRPLAEYEEKGALCFFWNLKKFSFLGNKNDSWHRVKDLCGNLMGKAPNH